MYTVQKPSILETMDVYKDNKIVSIGSEVQQQTRTVINNVLTFLTELKDPQKLQGVDFLKPRDLTAKICGVSLRTVDRIRKQYRNDKSMLARENVASMLARENVARPVTGLSNNDKNAIKHIVTALYKKGEYPSIEKVLQVAKQEISGFACGRSSMAKIMKELGFKANRKSAGIVKKIILTKQKVKTSELEEESNDFKIDDDTLQHYGWEKVKNNEDITGSISIEFGDNTYLSATDNGAVTIGARHDEGDGPLPEEIFTAFPTEETKFSLLTSYGKYLGVSQEGTVIGKSNIIGAMEQWELVWKNGKTVILSSLNTLMSVNPDNNSVVAQALTAGDLEFCTIRRNKPKGYIKIEVKEDLSEEDADTDEYLEVA